MAAGESPGRDAGRLGRDGHERADLHMRPDQCGGWDRDFDAAKALGVAVTGPDETMHRVAALEVVDPRDAGSM